MLVVRVSSLSCCKHTYVMTILFLSRPFFNCCDGIFLNYNWNWSLLSQTRKLAGDRLKDVYVGIDVFGRGCPGGGGYNSSEVCVCMCACV